MGSLARREFLARGWRWGLALLGVAGVWTSWDLLLPSAKGLGDEVRAVPAESVPDVGAVEVGVARAYLVRVEGDLLALSWKCPHLGCKVPYCESSGQFECPCHGSTFNRAGEFRGGPSPRGMDRFGLTTVDGVAVIDTGSVTEGGPPGRETIDEPVSGPSCLE